MSDEPVDKSSTTVTRLPCASSVSVRCEPIKPEPPVTRMFFKALPFAKMWLWEAASTEAAKRIIA